MSNAKRLLNLVAASSIALALVSASAIAEPPQHAKDGAKQAEGKKEKKEKKDKDAKIYPGATAPEFAIKDTEGNEHKLADLTKDGKVVVLQWFNADCPYVVKHYKTTKTFNDLYANYKDKGVVFFGINSSKPGAGGQGQERNAKAKTDWTIPYPILLDESGTTGKAYGAQNTPFMVVIDKDGKVAYMGAIDDDNDRNNLGKTNYVAKALDEVLAGKPVTTAETKPYGCGIRY
ncbi:MAG: thioredoxin family protein [Planctomycetota bacterium]|nr:thioredoxin family protein [Planctomycetota bacterium]